MTKTIKAILCICVMSAVSCLADVITVTNFYQSSSNTVQLEVPTFDKSLGTLNSIIMSIQGEISTTIQVKNPTNKIINEKGFGSLTIDVSFDNSLYQSYLQTIIMSKFAKREIKTFELTTQFSEIIAYELTNEYRPIDFNYVSNFNYSTIDQRLIVNMPYEGISIWTNIQYTYVIPEPSVLMLMILGSLPIILRRNYKKLLT